MRERTTRDQPAFDRRVAELREIEIFLALVEELHFGRTAERLHLSPARVSQTIRALERRVGGQLFQRTSRSVHLTALGERLRDELRPAYEQIHRAFQVTREAASGVTGELRVCVLSHPAGEPSFTRIIHAFETRHRGCRVAVVEAMFHSLDLLRRGEFDLVAHWLPLDGPDLTVGPLLSRQERILLIPVDHPLAERGHASAEDLGDYGVIKGGVIANAAYHAGIPQATPSGRPIERSSR